MKFFNKRSPLYITAVLMFIGILDVYATDPGDYVKNKASNGSFPLAGNGKAAPLLLSSADFPGVLRVASHLQDDIKKVTGTAPQYHTDSIKETDVAVIIGTYGKSPLIEALVKTGKINAKLLEGKWEKFITLTIDHPLPGIKKALVIAGSDKRGTIYGIYDLSAQIGVHPWHYWADIPVKKQHELHVTAGIHTRGEPRVKYRGIFINDEAPALSGWAFERFGGFNARFYDKVFELILRMKGNYLWPAMWGRMFYVEDPENPKLADEYGIVMGTSHHEPLTRAHAEWGRFGKGDWNYNTNPEALENFWREGMQRRGATETIVSIGMRGDGDEPMTEGTAIALLEDIVKKQREIIAETTGKPAAETPQLWALYKEVQEYYDKGMRVPEDVTLLLCDDNWGNIRKLPEPDAKPRAGGYGIYYHFDYVGGPRNYKWINTNQIERTWEQMHLAYKHGADRIWIVNVGDIKPMEFPTQFFLDYAWDPEAWNAKNLEDYYTLWAAEIFGTEHSEAIADIMKKYTKYNARRKPELLAPSTYSLVHYNEADRVAEAYRALAEKAAAINEKLPEAYKDAYYQLVLFPVLAAANLNALYVATAKNHWYAAQSRAMTNAYAEKVKQLFAKDAELTEYYHKKLSGGKWNHIMSQTHIGYTYWQQPEQNTIPETKIVEVKENAAMGISVEGSEKSWCGRDKEAALPVFDPWNDPSYSITLFNKGKKPFKYTLKSKDKWIKLSADSGRVDEEENIAVTIDWAKAPEGVHQSAIYAEGTKQNIPVIVTIYNKKGDKVSGFVESNGYVAMEAEHFTKAVAEAPFQWTVIPNLGRTLSGITLMPVSGTFREITAASPRLEYNVHLFSEGEVKVNAYFSPTLNYMAGEGLKYGIAFDDAALQIINVHEDASTRNWNQSVANNIKILSSTHRISKGNHVLKCYMANSGLVLQKIVIETEDTKHTYLGPPESYYAGRPPEKRR